MDEQLRGLSEEFVANSQSRLRQVAHQHGLRPSKAELQAALAPRASAHQLFAPPPRSNGKSAAERPGSRLQSDLIDFSKNGTDGQHHYGLLLSDVYSRMAYTKPLEGKTTAEVTAGLRELVKKVPGGGHNAALSTDAGGEFAGAGEIPGLLHRVKKEGDRNAIAVADRSMMTIKKDLAGEVALKGGTWAEHLAHVTKAFDGRYQAAVHGAPATVAPDSGQPYGANNVQNFLCMQDQASNFQHNAALTKKRVDDVQRQGAYREAISNGGRSFKAAYGPVHQLDKVTPGGLTAWDNEGHVSLLKLAKAVPRGSKEAVGSMVRQPERAKRKAPVAGSGTPMGKIPLAAGTPLQEGRQRLPKEPGDAIPEPAAAASSSSSSSRPATVPQSKEDRFAGLRLMQGYLGPKRSEEELAAAKAKAAENKRLKEAEDARKAAEKAQKAREKAAKEAGEKAAKEARKELLKGLVAARHADDKARKAGKKS